MERRSDDVIMSRSIIDDLMDPGMEMVSDVTMVPSVSRVGSVKRDIMTGMHCVERDCGPKIRNPETNCCIDPSGRVAARLRRMRLIE